MIQFTNIIGAKVISAYNCEFLGTVINMQFSNQNNKIKHLIIASKDEETIFILPKNKIFAIGDCIIVRNKTALSVTAEDNLNNLINNQVVTLKGNDYGKINEIFLDKKLNIIKLATQNYTFFANQIIYTEKGISLINDTEKKYKNSTFSPHPAMYNDVTSQNLVNALNEEMSPVATPRTIIARLPKNFKNPI